MREFAHKGSVLRHLDRGGKVVYTAFLVSLVGGLVTAAFLHGDSMGASSAAAAAYWRGDEAQMIYPKSDRQLLELTHFHLFTEPMVWLVVAHLYRLGRGQALVSVVTLICMALQIAMPWAIAKGSAAFGILALPATAGLLLGLLWMIGASLREMWWPPSSSPS
jgi:hypothetical protein